jgi:hypothetical protein
LLELAQGRPQPSRVPECNFDALYCAETKGGSIMDSPLVDQSRDPLLAFATEASVTPAADPEPAFLRIPTPYNGHLSVTSILEQPPSETARAGPTTSVLIVAGVLAGFIGGYAFAGRIIGPAATPADRVTTAVPAAPPAAKTAPVAASETPAPRTELSTEPTREPSVVKAAQEGPSTTARPRPEAAPTTRHEGAIQIVSRPSGAQVLLDGSVVGRTPMSIASVAEGMHDVRVELDGFSPWAAAVRVRGGNRTRVGASLEP